LPFTLSLYDLDDSIAVFSLALVIEALLKPPLLTVAWLIDPT